MRQQVYVLKSIKFQKTSKRLKNYELLKQNMKVFMQKSRLIKNFTIATGKPKNSNELCEHH